MHPRVREGGRFENIVLGGFSQGGSLLLQLLGAFERKGELLDQRVAGIFTIGAFATRDSKLFKAVPPFQLLPQPQARQHQHAQPEGKNEAATAVAEVEMEVEYDEYGPAGPQRIIGSRHLSTEEATMLSESASNASRAGEPRATTEASASAAKNVGKVPVLMLHGAEDDLILPKWGSNTAVMLQVHFN